jgi:hypothetical protein
MILNADIKERFALMSDRLDIIDKMWDEYIYKKYSDFTLKQATIYKQHIKCKMCNNDIYFDEKRKSDNGKFIPIARLTNQYYLLFSPVL